MKKIFATLCSLALFLSLTVLASCGGAPSNAEVKSILDKDELTQSDYTKLIDYMEAAYGEAMPIYEKQREAKKNDDMDKVMKLQEEGLAITKKYEYMSAVSRMVDRASDDELGESNVKKLEAIKEKYKNF